MVDKTTRVEIIGKVVKEVEGKNLVLILDELDRLRTVTDTASVTTPADGATYNAASMPTTFSGQVGDDANQDGSVNALDITKVERIIARMDDETPGADANQDGSVNALDIIKVERIIAGLD